MAQENVGINITVGGNQDQALGSLKAQLREATAEVTKLSEQFGASSKEAVQAAKRAAELKDQIGDAKSLIDAFNPDAKFKALTASLSGVAGGFAAAQGAIGLFGVESENVEKAQAISNLSNSVINSAKAEVDFMKAMFGDPTALKFLEKEAASISDIIDRVSKPAFKLPRLIRHGVPIISTVPAEDSTFLTESEKNAYSTGLGEMSKKLYFKIVCNSILESTLTIGSSSKCQLKLYLPNGLDTVKAAEYITMTLLHKDTAKNISIYYAEYIFHKSGIQDNIEYVDGYMYLDVYSPVTVQRDIPLQFDFLIS